MIMHVTSAVIYNILAFAGGGGSGGGGGGGGGGSFSGSSGGSMGAGGFITLSAAAVLLAGAAAFANWKMKRNLQLKVQAAAAKDTAWNPEHVIAHATEVFMRYQEDWSNYNLQNMKTYLTPRYYQHNVLMIQALELAARRDWVKNPHPGKVSISEVDDSVDNTRDKVVVTFSGMSAEDTLLDTRTNETLYVNNNPVTQKWHFIRNGNEWLLDTIVPSTTLPVNLGVELLAKQKGMYYSADWGSLLLPREGHLFKEGSFEESDINNHCIGMINTTLVQIYNYVPSGNDSAKPYLVAQANVPKSYGRILVTHKQGGLTGMLSSMINDSDLQKIETEWPDFNKKYSVQASSAEGATSLELLNPLFMQQLEALPIPLSIEVVDNVVYLFSEGAALNQQYLSIMLDVLQKAYKEMRL